MVEFGCPSFFLHFMLEQVCHRALLRSHTGILSHADTFMIQAATVREDDSSGNSSWCFGMLRTVVYLGVHTR